MIVGDEKPSLAELTHYGVKGMKWGVRRSTSGSTSAGPRQEKTEEQLRRARQRQLMVAGAAYAAILLAQHGGGYVASRAAQNREAAKFIRIGADAAKIPYVTPNRSGVHKITTMK